MSKEGEEAGPVDDSAILNRPYRALFCCGVLLVQSLLLLMLLCLRFRHCVLSISAPHLDVAICLVARAIGRHCFGHLALPYFQWFPFALLFSWEHARRDAQAGRGE